MTATNNELATLEQLPDPVLAKAASRRYQELCAALLEPTDWQRVSRDKSFAKKSAYVKLAKAYGVSVETVATDETRNEGRIIRASARVRATDPTGRYWESGGACSIDEKGRDLSAKPEHDLPATAETRAANRAISNLIGFGEISAEEADPAPADDLADDELERQVALAAHDIAGTIDGYRLVVRLGQMFGNGLPVVAARAILGFAWELKRQEDAWKATAPPEFAAPPQ